MNNHPKARKAGTSKAEAKHKKALFVEAMISNGGNQTQAAESAGYKPGKAAEQAGMRLSKDVGVSEELSRRRAELQKEASLETERVLSEVARIVFSDIRKLFRENGTLKDVAEWPADIVPAIASVEVTESQPGIRTTKIKLWDKLAAIEKAMKHLGLYEKDNKQQAEDPLARLLREISERGSIL